MNETFADEGPIDQRSTEAARNGLERYQLGWDTFWETDFLAADWLLEPLLAKGRTHSIVAAAKAGKSLLVLEACAALATGRSFLNKPEGDPVTVAYVDYEMTAADVQDRLREFGYGPDDDLSHLIYILLPDIPPLDTCQGGATFVADILDLGVELVVIDTVSRAVGGEENAAETARDLYRHTLMPLKLANVATARLDHLGKDKDKGPRGSSAKTADVDIEWLMAVKGDTVSLFAKNTRMAWVPKEMSMTRSDLVPMHRFTSGQRVEKWDATQWMRQNLGEWVTAEAAAKAMCGRQSVASQDKRKARDALNCLVDLQIIERKQGQRGGGGGSAPNVYRLVSETV